MSVCKIEDIMGVGLSVVSDTPVMEVKLRVRADDEDVKLWFFFGYTKIGDTGKVLVVFTRTPDLRVDEGDLKALDDMIDNGSAKVFVFGRDLRQLSSWFSLAHEKKGFLLKIVFKPVSARFLSYSELTLVPTVTEWFNLSDHDVEIVRQIAEKLK